MTAAQIWKRYIEQKNKADDAERDKLPGFAAHCRRRANHFLNEWKKASKS